MRPAKSFRKIVEYLKDPGRFGAPRGQNPKGALLAVARHRQTLLARAIAGEAGVLLHHFWLDFVEMFVGDGASRVRDMFDQAKKSAPASSSSTKLTPSAATAEPASATATTSASRP